MKETTMKSQSSRQVWGTWMGGAMASLLLMGAIAGCAVTQQASVQRAGASGFLGDTSMLTPGDKEQASLRYVNPAAQWTRYKKVLLEPVTFWGDEQSKLSPEDQQMLVNYFYQVLNEELAEKLQVVHQPGRDVLNLEVAVTDVEAATRALRSISMVVPQARLLATLKRGVTGSYPFVGGAQAEFKITDAMTGDVLAVGVDRRIGGGSVSTAAVWQWGDAENAMRAWAKLLTERLSVSTTGAAKPS